MICIYLKPGPRYGTKCDCLEVGMGKLLIRFVADGTEWLAYRQELSPKPPRRKRSRV